MSGRRVEKPFCQGYARWLEGRLGRGACAPLTGQDSRALRVFVHALDLYGCSDDTGRRSALTSMSAAVAAMQPTTRHLAKETIAYVLDWGFVDEIWPKVEREGRFG